MNNKQPTKQEDGSPLSVLLLIENAVDQQLRPFACCVLTRLLTHRNHKTGLCNPLEAMLAEALGVHERKVRRAIKELKDAEFISIKRRFQASNLYTFNLTKAVNIDLKNKHTDRTPVAGLRPDKIELKTGQNRTARPDTSGR